jgi:PPP family 3-phenylpropionic acid transporter
MKKIYPFSFYLLYFGANTFFLPYVVLYYQSLGFTGTQIGLLSAISPLISLAGAPFWTGLADSTHRHKAIMAATMLAAIGLVVIFPFAKTIAAVFVLLLLFSFMMAPVNSLADTATMTLLGDETHLYGRVRVGGTVGWGLLAPVAGLVIERFGLSWGFWSYAIIMFMGFLVSQKFSFSQVKHDVSVKHGLRALFSNKRLVLFLVTAFICGTALMSINMYLSAYMTENGISKTVIGTALSLAVIVEFPALFYADRLLAKLKPHGMLILSLLTTAARLFLYALFPTQTGILVFQLINGLMFASVWVAGVSYMNEIAPPGLVATAQGVFASTMFGFGAAGGGFLGAILLERVGGANMYAIFGALVLAALMIYLALEKRLPQEHHAEI